MIKSLLIQDVPLIIKAKINELILKNFKNSRLNTYKILVYEIIDNEIIGFLGLDYYDEYLSINQLCVDNNNRNKGIATNLLNYINKTFKNNFLLFVDKEKSNYQYLIDFYKKNGFTECSPSNPNECKMIKLN
jgi:ribosomal protein S18 acetylase RimI-like enzyme